MANHKMIIFLLIVLGTTASVAEAGILRVINKLPDQRVQIFIRGEGADSFQTQVVEKGSKKDFIINKEQVSGKNTFEVTASTGNGGNPDWKLMGGTCSNLVTTDADHTLTIDSILDKITCTNVTADNPPASY